ncbi:MAG TPA: ABC transporter permease, partial [Candidatus Limnocylindrales bacterium]
MRPLIQLTIANIRSFARDRAAMFWTLAFPLIFILMFGAIFTGGGSATRTFAWVDLDGSAASASLRTSFAGLENVELTDEAEADALAAMREGDVRAVLIVPDGYGAALAAAGDAPRPPVTITVYTDPTQQNQTADTFRFVDTVLGRVNLEVSGRGPA